MEHPGTSAGVRSLLPGFVDSWLVLDGDNCLVLDDQGSASRSKGQLRERRASAQSSKEPVVPQQVSRRAEIGENSQRLRPDHPIKLRDRRSRRAETGSTRRWRPCQLLPLARRAARVDTDFRPSHAPLMRRSPAVFARGEAMFGAFDRCHCLHRRRNADRRRGCGTVQPRDR